MNVVYLHDHELRSASAAMSSPGVQPRLDRTALATAAAERQARAAEIEADIGHACKVAALRPDLCSSTTKRHDWNRRSSSGRTWDRYVAEAVRQAQARAAELETLHRETAQLDRLLEVSRSPASRSAAGGRSPPIRQGGGATAR